MRTLEEVIETMTLTCDVNSQYREQNADVLHYLKSYQDALKQMEENQQIIEDAVRQRDAHIKALAELNRNEPLTWDELKQMEGMPVWVELGLLKPRWYLIKEFHGDQMICINDLPGPVPIYEDSIYTGGCKVYRKERRKDELCR